MHATDKILHTFTGERPVCDGSKWSLPTGGHEAPYFGTDARANDLANVIVRTRNQRIFLWDTDFSSTDMPFGVLKSEEQIYECKVAPATNGDWLSTRFDGSTTVNIWNITNPRSKGLPFMEPPFEAGGGNRTVVAYSSVSATMATVATGSTATTVATQERDVEFRKLHDGEFVVQTVFKSHVGAVFALAINATDSIIASAGTDDAIILYSTELGAEALSLDLEIKSHKNSQLSCLGLAFSPLREKTDAGAFVNTLASCGTDCAVKLWTIIESVGPSGPAFSVSRPCLTLNGHGGWAKSVTFSLKGDSVISGGVDQQLYVWSQNSESKWLPEPTVLKVLEGKERSGTVTCVAARDGLILSGTAIGFVAVHTAKHTSPLLCQRCVSNSQLQHVSFSRMQTMCAQPCIRSEFYRVKF